MLKAVRSRMTYANVMATVAVRFAFPAVSAEGSSFWIIRTSPITLHDFLWSKFWTAFAPVLLLTEVPTITANEFLGIDPFLKVATALANNNMTGWTVGQFQSTMSSRLGSTANQTVLTSA